MEDQVLMVDVSPVLPYRTLDNACYIPSPFVEELLVPNTSHVIPNVSVDIILFIYPLADYNFVLDYLKSSSRSR